MTWATKLAAVLVVGQAILPLATCLLVLQPLDNVLGVKTFVLGLSLVKIHNRIGTADDTSGVTTGSNNILIGHQVLANVSISLIAYIINSSTHYT